MTTIRVAGPVDADVAVVGAGPGGAATAAHLARRGLDVVLIERASFPRDKVCGDFLSPIAIAELDALGLGRRPEFSNANTITRAAVHLDGDMLVERLLPGRNRQTSGRVIPRLSLDALIVDTAVRAGARLIEGTQMGAIRRGRDGTVTVENAEGRRVLRARVVVGADGSNSTVARTVRGGPPPRADRIIAVRAYFEGVGGPPDRADLYFSGDSFPGYYWLFPTGNGGANVGVGMVLDTLPRVRAPLRDLLVGLAASDDALRQRLVAADRVDKIVGWPLTTYNPSLPVVADGVVLVGDAAGLINSLNGEGIQYALLSARWASETVADAVENGDTSASTLRPYADRIVSELGTDLTVARMVVRLISYRALNPVWLLALRVIAARAAIDPDYAQTTGGVLAGVVPAQAVLSPKVVARTLTQALITAGAEPVRAARRQPSTAAGIGIEVARTAFDIGYDTAREPREVIRWASSSITTATTAARTAIASSARRRS